MNQKVSLQDFAELLSASTGQSLSFCENFVKELLNVVSETLISGENVSIKGLGDFVLSPDSPDKLRFAPAPSFAEQVNAPFSHFMPEKLRPEISESDLESVETFQPEITESVEDTVTSVSAPVSVSEDMVTGKIDEEFETGISVDSPASTDEVVEVISLAEPSAPAPSPTAVNQPIEIIPIEEDEEEIFEENKQHEKPKIRETELPVADAVSEPDEETIVSENPEEESREDSGSSGFGLGFLLGCIVGLAVGAAAMFFYAGRLSNEPVNDEVEDEVVAEAYQEQPADTILPAVASVEEDSVAQPVPDVSPAEKVSSPEPAPEPAPKARPVTDKVRAGYLMPKMAQKHYGNQVFWVYIYEENKAKISNPNNLTAGLELVIPAPEKYGIDASDPKSVARAQAKEKEIWNRK